MAEPNKNANYSVLKRQQYLSLTDIAYNTLLEAIINQDFPPGAPVSIDNLAAQLNMSNTPVREALMRAHGERLVTQKTNRGFLVSDILKPNELKQLFEVRHVLEVYALSVANVTSEAIDTVSNLVEQMASSGDGTVYVDFQEYMVLDHQFHRTLIELSQNEFLVDAWEDLHVHLHLSRLYTGVGLFDRDHSRDEHRAIAEALQQSNVNMAASLLSNHIKRVEKRMQSFLSK
jgi:DNA-binding GntR family transcriptional regulator